MKVNLKTLRQSKGWTQEQTALELDVSLSYIKKLDAGYRTPGLRLVQKMVVVFGCESIDEVIQAS